MEIKDRVLVVEDDKRISNFIKTVLEANNYDVIVAQTGAEAYSMVTSQCPDVVILDLGLPDMDGMKILQGALGYFSKIFSNWLCSIVSTSVSSVKSSSSSCVDVKFSQLIPLLIITASAF